MESPSEEIVGAGHDSLAEQEATISARNEKRQTYNVAIMGLGFFCLFSAFNTIQPMVGGML